MPPISCTSNGTMFHVSVPQTSSACRPCGGTVLSGAQRPGRTGRARLDNRLSCPCQASSHRLRDGSATSPSAPPSFGKSRPPGSASAALPRVRYLLDDRPQLPKLPIVLRTKQKLQQIHIACMISNSARILSCSKAQKVRGCILPFTTPHARGAPWTRGTVVSRTRREAYAIQRSEDKCVSRVGEDQQDFSALEFHLCYNVANAHESLHSFHLLAGQATGRPGAGPVPHADRGAHFRCCPGSTGRPPRSLRQLGPAGSGHRAPVPPHRRHALRHRVAAAGLAKRLADPGNAMLMRRSSAATCDLRRPSTSAEKPAPPPLRGAPQAPPRSTTGRADARGASRL